MSGSTRDAHFARLRDRHPEAERLLLGSGAALISLPAFPLPPGWNATSTTIRYIEFAQYPFASPDCFWADTPLRLANGQEPQSSSEVAIPETQLTGRWFSWHVRDRWNANTDDHMTWISCITDRLRRTQ